MGCAQYEQPFLTLSSLKKPTLLNIFNMLVSMFNMMVWTGRV